MNLELLESFGQNYPEEFDGVLDCISLAVTCTFNKHGTLLAVGCNDGRIVIWDFLTRGIAKVICAHVQPVSSLSWSRTGHKLLSASTDSTVCNWDVLGGDCSYRYRFPSPVLKVQFHPRNEKTILICPMKHAAVLVNIEESHRVVPVDDESDLSIIASFDRKGTHLYTGNGKGKILVFSVPDLELKASFRIMTGTSNTTSIKSIAFAQRGDCFLVNSADRIIRVYKSTEVLACGKDGDPEPMQKLQDLVNKTVWKKCVFSGDGEYICAGSARQHSLYIWEKTVRNPVKILHGRKGELLLDVVWHPFRPIITSISSGVVSVWSQPQVENWSAFAPDFKELDENVEYEERESEFDIEDEDKSPQIHADKDDEDEMVDVVTVDRIAAFCSSSDEDDDSNALLYLPTAPEVEDPEEGWAQGPETPAEEPQAKKLNSNNNNNNSEPLTPNKKKRTKVDEGARKDEQQSFRHSKSKDKTHQQTKKSPKSKAHKSYSESKNSHRSKHVNKERSMEEFYDWQDDDSL